MTHHRSGAALIMAIVILAALLMLGLPFLFSQSASLTGTRSFAHSQMAQAGRSTAEDLGVGAAYYIVNRNLPAGSTGESTDINNIPGGLISQADPRRLTLDLSPTGHGFNPAEPRNTALLGLSLEDESGKLDPNHMDVEAWMRLFDKVGIADWDDGDDGPGGRLDDDIDEGQLAYALAAVRFDRSICREGRVTRFEQFLEAKPQPDGVRHPLTRSELRQLMPFLTLGSVGQGREGMIDLGTMISYTTPGSATQERLDSLRPAELIGFPVARELIGAGSVLVSEPAGGMPAQQRSITGKYYYGMSTSIDLETVRDGSRTNPPYPPDSHRPRRQEAVGIEVQAPVNINETSEPVRWVFKDVTRNNGLANQLSDMLRLTVNEFDAFNRVITGFTLQNPLGVYSALGTSKVLQTQPRDPNHGLSGDPPVANGKLTDSATWIHISGGNLSAMPHSGYARIESASSATSGTAATSGSQSIVEYIFYNNGNNLSGGTATLHNVRRGLAFPGSTGAHEHDAATSQLTFIAPRELPPLGLASQGIVTIESGSSVADAAGRQGAQQFRRVVAQAVPQEQLLEMRWDKQSHYHALLVQRHGSLMNAFPKAYQRQYDVEPDNQGQTNAANHDLSTGVRPATLRTLLTSTHLGTNWRNGHAWSRSFSMEKPGYDPLAMGDMEYAPSGGGYSASDLMPEGLTLRGTPLSYDAFREDNNGVKNGFFTYPLNTSFSPPINGRQFGMWVKPNKPLSGDVTFFDFRSPPANAGQRFARKQSWLPLLEPDGKDPREPGDNYYQNRISLTYEDQTKQLVLTIANGAIEHTEDHGPIVPSEFFTFPTGGAMFPPATSGPYVDPRSLGNEAVPGVIAGINPIGAKFPMNLVQHRYQLDKTHGLKAHMWHQIQVAFVGNDPGHMAIIVDGVVGQTMTKLASMTTMERGDHVTLPSLVLRTALTGGPNANSASLLVVPTIELDAIAVDPVSKQMVTGAPAIAALLPKRGIIRVNNEYISYDNLTGTTLVNCLRARRQDSIVGLPRVPDRYPQLEAHLAGALVVPGGIRFNPGNNGHLWKGGCTLTEALPNGGPIPQAVPTNIIFDVWGELTKPPKDIDPITGLPVLLATVTTIKVQGGVLPQWPSRGYARLPTGEIIYYDNGGSKPTTDLLNVQRSQFGTTASDILFPIIPVVPTNLTVSLISFEVTGSPTGNYAEPPAMPIPGVPPEVRLVQILDANTGRIEWLSYDRIDVTKGPGFFISHNLYRFDPLNRSNGERAQQRTAFAGVDIPSAPLFAPASRVIPVQTTLGSSHLLVTGDILTIVPKKPGAGTNGRPVQVCVRYAATDGVSPNAGASPPANNSWDTYNRDFAFTEALDENWLDGSFEVMSWPAWSGNDLSSNGAVSGNLPLPAFSMPLADAFSPGYAAGGQRQIFIGGDDTSRPFLQATTTQPFDGVIDAVYAGEQAGGTASTNNPTPEDNLIINFFGKPKFTSGEIWLAVGAPMGLVIVEATNPIFAHDLGIVQIGGEVFAYERQHNPNGSSNWQVIRLIGRGLFGSTPVDHVGPEPVVILPIGPVTRLVQALANGEQEVKLSQDWRKRSQTDEINAPAIMLYSPDVKIKKMELMAMPNRHTASWLRGMYNTVAQKSWLGNTSTSGTPNDTLAIGWWPRYPSGIHNQQTWPSLQTERSALLRCRMYGWMGYPIRFHDTWLGGGGLASVELLDDGQGTYSVFASALEEGFDWTTAANSSFSLTAGGGYQDASAIFSRFQQKPVNGVEMRIRWEYVLPPADAAQYGAAAFLDRVATAGNTAPMIGKVKLRARAPVKILQVEEAR